MMTSPRRMIYITAGTLFLLLGAIGIFVPLLPTTPFWLLTCWFYIRSSEALYRRVMANRYFGSYMRSFLVDKAIPLRSKILSIGIMWTSFVLTAVFLIDRHWIAFLLFVVSAFVTAHILSYPTKKID